MDSSIFPLLFLACVLLPIVLGFGVSLWLVGSGRRAAWAAASIAIWIGAHALLGRLIAPKLSLVALMSEWYVAGLLVTIAYIVKRRAALKAGSTGASAKVTPKH